MYVYVCVCVCVCVGRNESLCVKGETGRMFTGKVVDVWRERRDIVKVYIWRERCGGVQKSGFVLFVKHRRRDLGACLCVDRL